MFRVTHNGMKIEYKESIAEINNYIDEVLSAYLYLEPKLIYNYKIGHAQLLIYRYSTVYSEMFLIEEVH